MSRNPQRLPSPREWAARALTIADSITYPDGTTLTGRPVGGDRDLQPEGAQAGLDAGSVGVKYTGAMTQTVDPGLLTGAGAIRFEAATTTSVAGVDVTAELYDTATATVLASVVMAGGGQASTGVLGALNAGNDVQIRWNVTTAALGETFTAHAARLVIV